MADYPYGVDYEFLATDAQGYVARFTTGGDGPVPVAILEQHKLNDAALEALYALPRVSKAHLLVALPRPDDFREIAELGFFGYDWQDVHRTGKSKTNLYEPISVPTTPCSASALPAVLQAALNLLRLPAARFSPDSAIDIQALVRCVLAA